MIHVAFQVGISQGCLEQLCQGAARTLDPGSGRKKVSENSYARIQSMLKQQFVGASIVPQYWPTSCDTVARRCHISRFYNPRFLKVLRPEIESAKGIAATGISRFES
jgi:hypothetical protein